MPDGLSGPEQLLFLALRQIYWQLRNRMITRDAAIREKQKLVREYQKYSLQYSMWLDGVSYYKKCEMAASEVRKDKTLMENDKVIALIKSMYKGVV